MKRLVVLVALGAIAGALGSVACGGGDKPPLTPDTEHSSTAADDAGGGSTTPGTGGDAG